MPQAPQVRVDTSLILESVKSVDLRTGIWLNIIGYVEKTAGRRYRAVMLESIFRQADRASIQALVLWSAGSLKIGDYERILRQQQDLMEQPQTTH